MLLAPPPPPPAPLLTPLPLPPPSPPFMPGLLVEPDVDGVDRSGPPALASAVMVEGEETPLPFIAAVLAAAGAIVELAPPPVELVVLTAAAAAAALRFLIFAILRTRRLRRRVSELLLRQLSTARWISPLLPRRLVFNCASAQPSWLHSVSYCSRLPLYSSRLQQARG